MKSFGALIETAGKLYRSHLTDPKNCRIVEIAEIAHDLGRIHRAADAGAASGRRDGVERQWRQRMAGLRTNALVATGAALFVMLGSMIAGESSPTRVVSYVVSGIGFLGGGVILREGFTVRGLNTAATLWCAAAVGCLAGWGFLPQASIAALSIIAANVVLRPVAMKINRQPLQNTEVETHYTCSVVCRAEDEAHVRTLLLLYGVNNAAMRLQALDSEDLDGSNKVQVQANLIMTDRNDTLLEQVISRLSLEPGVSAVSWKVVENGAA
jgi:putative Mg2+ transporter-C (MgtC) family protein